MKEKTQRRPSALGKILGIMGFMSAAGVINKPSHHVGRHHTGGGFYHGNPIYFPPRKKYKGSDKPTARRNTYKKFKKYK